MRPLTVLLSSTGLVACLAAGGSCERPAAVQPPLPPGTRVGWYVTIDGSSNGNGTNARPWDLQTALGGGNGQVHPGDTIWLRAGTYAGAFHSELTGTAAAAIVVRQYPGERAILDGRGATSSTSRGDMVIVNGSYAVFRDFEIMDSDPNRTLDTRPNLMVAHGSHLKFINLIVHDGGIRLMNLDRKSTRLNSSHVRISYSVFCLKKKNTSYPQSPTLSGFSS